MERILSLGQSLLSHNHYQVLTDSPPEVFRAYRERMNKRILETDNLVLKRFYNLDSRAYEAGALPEKTKELLGLMGSMVLRCDDCIAYHVEQCIKLGTTEAEFFELLSLAHIVGGSIVIPHARRAVAFWDAVMEESKSEE
jgi:AhpD family alkylhydroperoxidase